MLKELDLCKGGIARARVLTRPLILVSALTLGGFGILGCGGTTAPSSSTPRTSAAVGTSGTTSSKARPSYGKGNDIDGDTDANNDDYRYGHAASSADKHTISMLLKSYYEAAADDDGERACRMLYSLLAEEIPELYGEQPGTSALSGKTCPVVMAKFFKQYRRQLPSEAATIKVTTVRVKRNRAIAIMSFLSMPRRDILVHREYRTWKVDELMDTGLA